jgi:hypothetical protein
MIAEEDEQSFPAKPKALDGSRPRIWLQDSMSSAQCEGDDPNASDFGPGERNEDREHSAECIGRATNPARLR